MVIQETISEEHTMDETSTSEVESNPELVVAKGYGLSTGLAGQPNIFSLDARQAGYGDFDVVIKGVSRASIEYLEEDEALYKIKYYVSLPGDYQIEIKYDLHHIPGSPFAATVLDPNASEENRSRGDSESNATASVDSISTNDASEDEYTTNCQTLPILAKVLSPSGKSFIGDVIRKRNGKISVKFPREETGTYVVTMVQKTSGETLPGSPYKVDVAAQKLDTNMVASGVGLKQACIGDTNCFTVLSTKGMNVNNLCIGVLGQSGMKLKVFQNDSDSVDIIYDVKHAGMYIFHVHENGLDIPGSPFEVRAVHGANTEYNNKKNDKSMLTTLTLTLWHGYDAFGCNARTELKDTTGGYLAHSVVRRGRHLLEIRFLPNKNDEFTMSINFSELLRSSQIFKIKVTNFPIGKEIFKVSGDGLHTAFVNVPASVYLDTLLPISRSFTVEFDGPDKVDITQNRTNDGKFVIKYAGKRPGRYIMSLKYDGFHVGGSPFHVNVKDLNRNSKLLALTQDDGNAIDSNPKSCHAFGSGLSDAICGQPSNFTVDALNAGSGALMAGFDDTTALSEIVCKHMGNCVYDVQYRLDEPGTYKLSVLWAGADISGSPFTVVVKDENNNM